ncbi:ATP-binding protein [Polaribacter sp. R77954]|uniref:ATP-binding protein n=1 Tax=Polaribacter sp. R77954 TaxID=3093870 RepID=UPI0037C9C531
MSDFSLRRAQMVYILSLITCVVSLNYIAIGLKLGLNTLVYLHVICISFYLLCAYFAKKKNLIESRIIYLLVLNIGILSSASYIGQEGGIEFTFMFSMSLPFMIFSFKREKLFILIFCLLSIVLWASLYLTNFNMVTVAKIDPDDASKLVYPLSILSTLFLVIFQLFYFSHLNFNSLSSIHDFKEEAIEASKAKSKFLSTMSHEIRTPLNAVIGLSHILGDNNPRKDQVKNIDALHYSGKILLNLLNNVLDFSKMQSKKIDLDNIPTDVLSATQQIQKIHETSCLKKGIEMYLDVDEDIPMIWLDIVRFNQVINNLVSNAIKFTKKGSVTLRIKKVSQKEDSVTLLTEVQDTGIGIPKDKQETIWEAFSQASTTTNRLYGGTGLGLPIVKKIVNAMGADVKIDSLQNKGSRFYFQIKVKIASTQELKNNTVKKQHNFKGKIILLVEDNLINVMVAKQILEKVGLKVDVAHNGLIAVNMTKEKNYDAILMDIQMPVMDGYKASTEIRKFNTTTPILALSASVFMEVKAKINSSGMNGFIFKPFEPSDLLDKLEEVVI